MRVISPQCRDGAVLDEPSSENAFSLQLSAVVEDFATAYGQRERMSQTLMREKDRAGQFASVLSCVLERNVAGTLRTACNLLARKSREAPGGVTPSINARMQRLMLRELIAVEGLAYMARLRASGSSGECSELLPVIKQALGRLDPVFEKGRELGISECRPGICVRGSVEGIRLVFLNLFVEILCQEPAPRGRAVAMRCNEAIAEVTVTAGSNDAVPACEWNLYSPSVQVATCLARDLGILLTLSPTKDFECRLEFAILND